MQEKTFFGMRPSAVRPRGQAAAPAGKNFHASLGFSSASKISVSTLIPDSADSPASCKSIIRTALMRSLQIFRCNPLAEADATAQPHAECMVDTPALSWYGTVTCRTGKSNCFWKPSSVDRQLGTPWNERQRIFSTTAEFFFFFFFDFGVGLDSFGCFSFSPVSSGFSLACDLGSLCSGWVQSRVDPIYLNGLLRSC